MHRRPPLGAAHDGRLGHLREALSAADQIGDPPHLLAERDTLGFSASNVESDLQSVQIAWARARMSAQPAVMPRRKVAA